ncbi:MAG TPA: hypothetical protein VEL31_15555 [Ktedonobacteraceae bacterium]|nr:hypothetical protein [Ktedonobacteraceae bacterium]
MVLSLPSYSFLPIDHAHYHHLDVSRVARDGGSVPGFGDRHRPDVRVVLQETQRLLSRQACNLFGQATTAVSLSDSQL